VVSDKVVSVYPTAPPSTAYEIDHQTDGSNISAPGENIGAGIMINLLTHAQAGALLVSTGKQWDKISPASTSTANKTANSNSESRGVSNARLEALNKSKKKSEMDKIYNRIPLAGRGWRGVKGVQSTKDSLKEKMEDRYVIPNVSGDKIELQRGDSRRYSTTEDSSLSSSSRSNGLKLRRPLSSSVELVYRK
jgi:hypothetical protein